MQGVLHVLKMQLKQMQCKVWETRAHLSSKILHHRCQISSPISHIQTCIIMWFYTVSWLDQHWDPQTKHLQKFLIC